MLSSRDLVSRDPVAVAGNIVACRALRDAAIRAPIAVMSMAIIAAMLGNRDLDRRLRNPGLH